MKIINIIDIFDKYRIDYKLKGVKQSRHGWVQTHCVFCNPGEGWHLGYCFDKTSKFAGRFVCYKCGSHKIFETLSLLLDSKKEAYNILKNSNLFFDDIITKKKKKRFELPTDTFPLTNHHKNYLKKRGFDWKEIQTKWEVFSSGPLSSIYFDGKTIDYSNRLIIPISFNNSVVSFTSRDVSNKKKDKYKSCPEELEVISHKNILYGSGIKNKCVLVEGPSDVWRLGPGAVCTFGIKYTKEQIKLLSKYEEIFVLFDLDSQAQIQAKKIKGELNFRGKKVFLLSKEFLSKKDPGDLTPEEAKKIMESIF